MHLALSDKVHRKLFDGQGQIVESPVGSVGGVDNGLGLAGFQPLEQFRLEVVLVLPLGGQVPLHGSNERPGALGETVEVRLALFGAGLGVVVKGGSHSHQVTGVVDVHSPVLSCLVPSLVGLVGSKDQQQAQKAAGERKGVHGQAQDGRVLSAEDSGVDGTGQVRVFPRQHVPEHDQGGDHRHGEDLASDVLVDSRFGGRDDVLEEPIRGSVLDPILVAVNGAPKLSGFLSVRNVRLREQLGIEIGIEIGVGVKGIAGQLVARAHRTSNIAGSASASSPCGVLDKGGRRSNGDGR
mmetsp:Transcript_1962/g.3964  ORF Transcript_1962/g.3964 Transcript_1962/m.3964 type:complete len:295 (+) Transcript_1962:817-1701(+)